MLAISRSIYNVDIFLNPSYLQVRLTLLETFSEKLTNSANSAKSLVCIGLDPDLTKMPISNVFTFNQSIIDSTSDLVCAYKPNFAFYESLGLDGLVALERTVKYIRDQLAHVIVIGDCKRGDIGTSSEAYATAMFQVWGFDAVTINAWGGKDTVEAFVADERYGAFIWCRGSNPGSSDLQDLIVQTDGVNKPLYEHLATKSTDWGHGNLGLVVGATVPEQLRVVRELCPTSPILIPGIGAQGGELKASVLYGVDAHGRSAIISSSRGILYASSGKDYPKVARERTFELKSEINDILAEAGKGWP